MSITDAYRGRCAQVAIKDVQAAKPWSSRRYSGEPSAATLLRLRKSLFVPSSSSTRQRARRSIRSSVASSVGWKVEPIYRQYYPLQAYPLTVTLSRSDRRGTQAHRDAVGLRPDARYRSGSGRTQAAHAPGVCDPHLERERRRRIRSLQFRQRLQARATRPRPDGRSPQPSSPVWSGGRTDAYDTAASISGSDPTCPLAHQAWTDQFRSVPRSRRAHRRSWRCPDRFQLVLERS